MIRPSAKLAAFRASVIRVLDPRNWRPFVWVALVFGLASALAMVLVVVPPGEYRGDSAEGLYTWTLGIVLLRLGITSAGLAVVGATLRALSHNMPARKNLDFIGKLFAVAATSLVFIGALLSVPFKDLVGIFDGIWHAMELTINLLAGALVAELIVIILILHGLQETESPPAIRAARKF